ncbi:hypothetical protein THAOC_09987 [Thalassiosira oceanica]|uniref:RING-type domain-containing protein n=1 Tax=Thalassiosira oceanica TaxID=159749 RepID=K0SRB9_THAOC|nr:hypothetical protein THAOC_09987 [Thalassiosira oceanica]|eukprot:EJK68803.1 hypothetical protein THAOC_09987 [Thalassiosira oceanica]
MDLRLQLQQIVHPVVHDERRLPVRALVELAADQILFRGIPPKVGLDGFDKSRLVKRLWSVANNERMYWLTGPLLERLAEQDSEEVINVTVASPNGDGIEETVLSWLCRYKLFHKQHGFSGKDDMIALAIQAGADTNVKNVDLMTPIFFAAKYTTARAVELLLDGGADVNQKDCFGQSVWKTAVERPDVEIIELLIRKTSDILPVRDERFPVSFTPGGRRDETSLTLADFMLGQYSGFFATDAKLVPISWRICGPPSNSAMALALIRVLQGGARFSPFNASDFEDVNRAVLAVVRHIESPKFDHTFAKGFYFETNKVLRDVIFGRQLPPAIHRELEEQERIHEPNGACPICLNDFGPGDKTVTLYCGHQYCLDCVREFGRTPLYQQDDKRCPMCKRLICGDVLPKGFLQAHRKANLQRSGGVDRHDATVKLRERGPHVLTDDQLRFECKSLLNKTEGTRFEMLAELDDFMKSTVKPGTLNISMSSVDAPRRVNMDRAIIELSSSVSLVGNSNIMIIPPRHGPVVISIKVKGVPILATLSMSAYTIVPKVIADNFRLKTKLIKTSQLITHQGNTVKVAAVVDEFDFMLDDSVNVCLNNAIITENQDALFSIQLGADFFASAAWTRCCTPIFDEGSSKALSHVIVDGGFSDNVFLPEGGDEMRYYSRDGKISQIPFIHVMDLAGGSITLGDKEKRGHNFDFGDQPGMARGTQTALPQDSSIGSCANIYDAATTAFDQVPGTMATTGKVVACVLPDVYVWGLGDVRATQLMKNG